MLYFGATKYYKSSFKVFGATNIIIIHDTFIGYIIDYSLYSIILSRYQPTYLHNYNLGYLLDIYLY